MKPGDAIEVVSGSLGTRIRRGESFSRLPVALPSPRAEDYALPRTVTVGNADVEAKELLCALDGAEGVARVRRKKERRRLYKRVARMVPKLVAEIRVSRLVLRDLRGAIERGEELGLYVERVKDMLPVPFEEAPTFARVEEMPEMWARGAGELPR